MSPVAPVGPVAPVAPVGPVGPVSPVGPVAPPPPPPAPYSNWRDKLLYIMVCPLPGDPVERGMELISNALSILKSFEKFKLLLIFFHPE
jgi:hypothetical protein